MTEDHTPGSGLVANPLLAEWSGPLGAPPFDRVHADDFLCAFQVAIAEHRAEIEAIATDPRPPTFATVLAPLERAGATLGRVRRLFWTLSGAQSEPAIRAIEAEVSAMLSSHSTAINHDPRLFARIAALWATREADDTLSDEQKRLIENSYRRFVDGGAELGGNAKARFADIDARLGALAVQFGQNVLAACASWEMVLDENDLDGLPDSARLAARRRAGANPESSFLFTLDRGDVEDFLTYSTCRDLRERIWRGFNARADGGSYDNNPVLEEMVTLRQEKAQLLGHASYAAFKLRDEMAGDPHAAAALMERVWTPAREQAAREAKTLQRRIDQEDGGFTLEAWDWRFYAEQERREHHGIDGAAVKAHLSLPAVRDAAFRTAQRLFGLAFECRPDLPVYHPDVEAWEISDADGAAVGLLYTDYIARAEKHGGAWMGTLRAQERMDGPVTPIVYIVANFARALDGGATLLSLDEARTLFHEFGHALHALLSDVTYPSLSGTAVPRDFVEFPSKFMENWIVAPAVLSSLGMPEDLIAAIGRADDFGQGFATVEFLLSGMVDLAIHATTELRPDVPAILTSTLARLDPPRGTAMRHRLPHFTHVFDGGYAAAYYSYLWSEVLDADAWESLNASGDIFNPAVAARYRNEVLARGDSRDPMTSYRAFLGRDPDEAALIRARKLEPA